MDTLADMVVKTAQPGDHILVMSNGGFGGIDPQLRVAIITGAGEKFFSAGWDLKAAAEGEAPDADFGPGGFAGLTEIFNLDKPVIAAVNGYAFGGGFELALAADFIVCADNASFALPEAKLGIVPDSGGVLRLPKIDLRDIHCRGIANVHIDESNQEETNQRYEQHTGLQ